MTPEATHADVASTLDALITVKVWALSDVFERRLEQELSAVGMTPATFRLVGELMRSPEGLSQRELAERLRVRPPTVSTAVTRLVADGLVERVPDPSDARAYLVRLASDASLYPGAELLARIEADILSNLNASEQRQISSALDALLRRLTPLPEDRT